MGTIVDTDRLSTYDNEYVVPAVKAAEQLIKDTVGFTSKNLIKFPYYSTRRGNISGVNFIIHNDGSINVNGTAKEDIYFDLSQPKSLLLEEGVDYILTGCPSSENRYMYTLYGTDIGSPETYFEDTGKGTKVVGNGNLFSIKLKIFKGITVSDLTFYPMLRKASIIDDSYEVYREPISNEISSINNFLGSKNLIGFPYREYKIHGQDFLFRGITWTTNEDGSVTANGTVNSDSSSYYEVFWWEVIPYYPYEFDCVLSGCPEGGGQDTYKVDLVTYPEDHQYYDYGNGVIIPASVIQNTQNSRTQIRLFIAKGVTVSNLTFHPMLRPASIKDETYRKPSATNSQITDFLGANVLLDSYYPAYISNSLPILKRRITDLYYNGSLKSEIAAGNFKNVRPGDFIVGKSTGTTYYVVDLDYWWRKGDKNNVTENPGGYTHHLCIMPHRLQIGGNLDYMWKGWGNANKSWRGGSTEYGLCPWAADSDVDPQDTEAVGKNDTAGGYQNSYIKTYALKRYYEEWLLSDFDEGDVLKFRNIIGNAINKDVVSSGNPSSKGVTSSWVWVDSYCDLPSELNLYGGMVFSSCGIDVGIQKEQLSLFNQANLFDFYERMNVWTKAVASSSHAAGLSSYGSAYGADASASYWVCPLALIK